VKIRIFFLSSFVTTKVSGARSQESGRKSIENQVDKFL